MLNESPGELESAHSVVKKLGLVHLAREAVDKEPTVTAPPAIVLIGPVFDGGGHGDFEEFEGDMGGHDLAVADVGADEFAVLRAFAVLFCTQEVAG
jgi:hypothetical protein